MKKWQFRGIHSIVGSHRKNEHFYILFNEIRQEEDFFLLNFWKNISWMYFDFR